MSRLLITGASGFVGRWAQRSAAKAGWEVIPLLRSGSNPIDLTQFEQIPRVIKESKCDAILHLAAMSHPLTCMKQPKLAHKINVGAVEAIVSSAPSHCKIVFSSSVHVYGEPKRIPISEEDTLKPLGYYGELKLQAEKLVLSHSKGIVARAFHHTGPGQKKGHLFPDWLLQKQPVSVGNINLIRDILDVRDVVDAYLLLLKEPNVPRIVNVCSGKGISLRRILQKMLITQYIQKNHLMRDNEIEILIGNNQKLVELGWSPQYDLETTLSDMKMELDSQ